MLPPAYDPKYKAEDMNGLLVLDELGTWLNSRNWNQKDRLSMLNWLFLSRKDHWDIILLAQDHEMIDAQVRTTLCDYLVQASRLDRQKIPYLAPILGWLGFNQFMPRIHRYHVYYGLSLNQPPVESWTFTGRDFYDGYDTNQRFRDGMEALAGTLVDMRATYSYLPACYLTRHIFIARLQKQIEQLKHPLQTKQESDLMATKTKLGDAPQVKIILLSIGLVVFLLWRFFSGGFDTSKLGSSTRSSIQPAVLSQPENKFAQQHPVTQIDVAEQPVQSVVYVAHQTSEIVDYLLKKYRPRLSTTAYSPLTGFVGTIDFYDGFDLVETFSIKELHALGVTLLRKPYGVDLLYDGKSYIVSSWKLKTMPAPVPSQVLASSNVSKHQSDSLTDELYLSPK